MNKPSGNAETVYQTEAQWTASEQVYGADVIAITTDGANAGKHKLFKGTGRWTTLSYVEDAGPSGPVSTDDVSNDSAVTGATATAALNALNTAINTKGEIISSGTRQDVMIVHSDQCDVDGRVTVNLAVASADTPALASATLIGACAGVNVGLPISGYTMVETLSSYTVQFWDVSSNTAASDGTHCTFTVVGVRA